VAAGAVLAAASHLAPSLWVAPARAQGLKKVTWAQGYTGTVDVLAVYAAKERGIFRKNGLDVEIVEYRGGGEFIQSYAAGASRFGLGAALPALQGMARGVKITMVALSVDMLVESLQVPKNSPVKSFKELKGKRIGITRFGSLSESEVRILLKENGMAPTDVTLVPLGSLNALVAALAAGELDATINTGIIAAKAVADGVARTLVWMRDVVKSSANEVITATDEMIANEPDVIRALLRSYFEAAKYIRTYPRYAVAEFVHIWGATPAVAQTYYDSEIGTISPNGAFKRPGLEWAVRTAVELKLIDRPLDLAKVHTTKFVPVNVD
jgi:ABC-type nitrate/sulfonate/bicarbonate transport system substrate-binding protein